MKILATVLIVLAGATLQAGDVSSNLTQMALLYHRGSFDSASAIYTRTASETNPPSSELQLLFLRVLLAQGKNVSAKNVFEDYVKRNPADYRAWFAWGVLDTRLGEPLDGRYAFRRSIELNPNHGPSYLWLAELTTDEEKLHALQRVLLLEERESPTAKQAVEVLMKIKRQEQKVHNDMPEDAARKLADPQQ